MRKIAKITLKIILNVYSLGMNKNYLRVRTHLNRHNLIFDDAQLYQQKKLINSFLSKV